MTKVHISTALFGGGRLYRPLRQQVSLDCDITLKVYDDTNTPSRHNAMHPRLKGKIPKMLEWIEHDADYYVWMDAPFVIVSNDIGGLVKEYISGADMALFRHPWNNTILDEVKQVCAGVERKCDYLFPRYDGEPIRNQYEKYKSDKDFKDDTLFACGLIIYSRALVKDTFDNLMMEWFHHNVYWSVEDQVSLPYLLQKRKIKYNIIDECIYNNRLATYTQ